MDFTNLITVIDYYEKQIQMCFDEKVVISFGVNKDYTISGALLIGSKLLYEEYNIYDLLNKLDKRYIKYKGGGRKV